ncbi:MAG: hypothetical protein AB9842_08130 [Bacteroidales bacterium]
MEGRFSDVELTWISDVLDQHGEFVVDLLEQAIHDKNVKLSGDLESSLAYKTHESRNPSLQLSFLSYGRAIEIRYHKSRNTRKQNDSRSNRFILGARQPLQKKLKQKDTRWYAKTVYGSLNRLIGILMNEFSESEKQRIKGILEQRKLRAT